MTKTLVSRGFHSSPSFFRSVGRTLSLSLSLSLSPSLLSPLYFYWMSALTSIKIERREERGRERERAPERRRKRRPFKQIHLVLLFLLQQQQQREDQSKFVGAFGHTTTIQRKNTPIPPHSLSTPFKHPPTPTYLSEPIFYLVCTRKANWHSSWEWRLVVSRYVSLGFSFCDRDLTVSIENAAAKEWTPKMGTFVDSTTTTTTSTK